MAGEGAPGHPLPALPEHSGHWAPAHVCPSDEFEHDYPQLAVKMALRSPAGIPWVEFAVCGEPRKYVPLPAVPFCQHCQQAVERWAAKAPSKMVCEFRLGPDESRLVGQAPGGPSVGKRHRAHKNRSTPWGSQQ